MVGQPVDRAKWRQFAANNKDRCVVCGNPAQVTVNLTGTELAGGRRTTGSMIAKQQFIFCDDHGQLRFKEALRKLQGIPKLKG